MAKLVHDDIFNAVQRCLHQLGIQRDCPRFGAAPPAFLHWPDSKLDIRQPQRCRTLNATDGWTRTLNLTVPVQRPDVWAAALDRLNACLSFLTGDIWTLNFSRCEESPIRLSDSRTPLLWPQARVVSLFSGGLDSLVGVIDWATLNPGDDIILVGHHDNSGRARTDQKAILKCFETQREDWGRRITACHIPVWQSEQNAETTYRSRSFMFLSTAIYAASTLDHDTIVPVLMPENGTIAINMPLTASRRGSCSTRTAHPFFLQQLQCVLDNLGLNVHLSNPLEMKTKGEILSQCQDSDLLAQTYRLSTSCAKGGHNRHWVRKGGDVRHCGYCMPCLYRRAAIHEAGLAEDMYGYDLCAGEIAVDDPAKEHANDLRALLAFLREKLDVTKIEKRLRASSSFGTSDVGQHAATVARAMDEVRRWLTACAPNDLKHRAGLVR